MPLKIVCHECGVILYEGDVLKPIYELKNELDGRCPNCNRELASSAINAEVIVPPQNKEEKEGVA